MVGSVELLVDFQRPARVFQRGGEIPARLVHRTRVVGRDGHVGMRFAVNILHHPEGALREFGRIGDLPLRMQASPYVAETTRQGPDPFDAFVHGLCQATAHVGCPAAHPVHCRLGEPVRLKQVVAEFGKLILGDRAVVVSIGREIRKQDSLPGGSDEGRSWAGSMTGDRSLSSPRRASNSNAARECSPASSEPASSARGPSGQATLRGSVMNPAR